MRLTSWAAAALLASAAGIAGAQRTGAVPPLAHTRLVLPNGLIAILNEDHSVPIVAVNVSYRFGSKYEQPGHTGLAHLCEHLMGEGSPNEPQPAKFFIQSIGGTSAHWAATSEDRMQFYATVPANELETMLWLESDRMAAPLSRADDAHVKSVREVIRQERLQNRETQPYGGLGLSAMTQPLESAPYRIDPLGPMTDLDEATAADAKAFCGPYLVPNNAIIALSGDFSTSNAKNLITKYFTGIGRRPPPRRPVITPVALASNVRLVLEDPHARFAMLRFAWHGAPYAAPDRIALLAAAAALSRDQLMARPVADRTGRLAKLLIYDRGLATRVTADVLDTQQSGIVMIDVVPRPNASATRIEQLVDSVVADVVAHGLTARDIAPYQHAAPVAAITSLQTRAARADTLAHDELFAGDPVAYAKQLQRATSLSASDVSRVARAYFGRPHEVLNMIPAGKLNLISRPDLPYTNVTPVAKVIP